MLAEHAEDDKVKIVLKKFPISIRDISICFTINFNKRRQFDMETVYGEKEALDDALTSVKTATGNYNTFSNECVHENVRNVMLKILEQEHEIQDDVFKIMHDKGLYPTPEAESKKVEQAKQKFACSYKEI